MPPRNVVSQPSTSNPSTTPSSSVPLAKQKFVVVNGSLHMIVKPVKALCRSTLIHDVVTRGDVFAVNMDDQSLTIITAT